MLGLSRESWYAQRRGVHLDGGSASEKIVG